MANVFNRFPTELGAVDVSEDQTKWISVDKNYSFDFNDASTEELNAFRLGMAAKEINDKLNNGTLVLKNDENMNQANPSNMINPFSDDEKNYNIDSGFQNMGRQNENKVLSKDNGHSILGNDKDYPNGFSTRFLISLLAGFGLGVIAATIYIFTNLSKVTIYLQ